MKWIYKNKWETRIILGDYSIGLNRYTYDNTFWLDWYQVSNPNNYDMSVIELPKNIITLKDAKKYVLKYYEKQLKEMENNQIKDYRIDVIELHEVLKTYKVEAKNQKEAIKKAKNQDWYDATADEYTGRIEKIIIKKVNKN